MNQHLDVSFDGGLMIGECLRSGQQTIWHMSNPYLSNGGAEKYPSGQGVGA